MTVLVPSPRRSLALRSRYIVDFRAADLWKPDGGPAIEGDEITCRTGQIITTSRDGRAFTIDSNGRLGKVPKHAPRIGIFDGEPHLTGEGASTNEVTDSNDFSAGSDWGAGTGFTISAVNSVFLGETAYKHVDDGAGSRVRTQAVGVLSSGAETFSVIVENVDALITTIGLRDEANGWVILATFTWATGAIVEDNSTYGTSESFRAELLSNSGPNGGAVYRISVTGTPVNPANSRQLYLYPSGIAANTKSVIVHHGQHEERPFASSPIITTTGAASRAAETISMPFTVTPAQIVAAGGITIYDRFVEMGTISKTSARRWTISKSDNTDPRFFVGESSGAYSVGHDPATATFSTLAAGPSIGQEVEHLITLTAAGVPQITQYLDGTLDEVASAGTAQALVSPFSDDVLYINSVGTSNVGFSRTQEWRAAFGIQTIGAMRS